MAVVTGPLMSLSARGTIAKTITFAPWKGIQYARTRVIPANPQTTGQTMTREVFAFLQSYYKFAPSIAREPWDAAATGVPVTPINLVIQKNLALLRTPTDLNLMVLSPGARGGSPPTAAVSTPSTGQLSIAVTAPAIPSGWTITAAQGVAIKDQDPHDPLTSTIVAAEDTTSTYAVVLTGLDGGDVYQWGVWLKWMTPNGNDAYSVALRGQDTPA